MSKLQDAYQFFRLPPGCSFDEVKRRYKRMALAWHPDRMASDEARRDAEEEMKLINHYFDILRKHYQTVHNESGPCECRQGATAGNARQESKAGPNPSAEQQRRERQKQAEEEAARKMDEQRRQREAEEARRKEEEARRRAEGARQEMEEAVRQRSAFKDERIRWRVAASACACLVAMIIVGSICTGIRTWWDGVSAQWRNQSPLYQPQNPPNTGFTAYIPPYEQFPGGNPSSWQRQQQQEEQTRAQEARARREQDIYFCKLDIDRYQKAIEHSNVAISQLEAQISNPLVGDVEKQRLRELRDFQQRCLDGNRRNLELMQRRLATTN